MIARQSSPLACPAVIDPVSEEFMYMTVWTGISVTLTSEPTVGGVLRKCLFRMAGTVVGGESRSQGLCGPPRDAQAGRAP